MILKTFFAVCAKNALKSEPLPSEHVVYSASLEVRSSVVYASFIVALVFTPLLTLSGVAGRLFAPLGYSYILAILISLLTALSLTPALAKALLAQCKAVNEPPLTQWLLPIYSRFLVTTNRYFVWLISACVMASALALIKLSELPSQFLPELREGHYIVHTTSAPGTSLTESIRIGQQLTQHFLAIPGVESVSQWAGRAGRGADTYGSHYSEFEVRLKQLTGHEQHAVLEQIRALLNDFPGISSEANTFLTERIDETISGYTAPVAINIFGNDLAQLDQQAESVANIVRSIKGSSNVQVRSTPTAPLLAVNLKSDAMNFWQVSSTEVFSVLQAAFEARNIGLIQTGTESYGVSVTLAPEFSQEPTFLKKLPIRSEPNKLIELAQIADIQNTNTRYAILHEGGQRRQTVTSHVLNRDLDDFMQELRQRILTEIAPAQNTVIKFTGAAIEQAEARQQLIIQALLAGAGVLMLSYLAMQSLRHVMITLANLPFALIGGILAVLLTDTALSVGAVVGFITLFGITARNSIMLIAHYRYLLIEEKRLWNLETMVLGAGQRLPSIVMTALVTALAMLPIALNSDNPGREIMGPMASIIIGGLLSSTLLNLLLLPMLLLRFGDFHKLAKRNVVL
ncbi:efflux RND transporter permease subunit [Methylocucumis oryzae]|uniref:efflux RND transporter permease subunit n=1 Tax=Methylocucumis oryzae TaxID=1632867 RepID=UPI0023BA6FF9|nr:efflux RND transporter permease subunit [Methylocucumis oryzae]